MLSSLFKLNSSKAYSFISVVEVLRSNFCFLLIITKLVGYSMTLLPDLDWFQSNFLLPNLGVFEN